jgi:hypothetical protein
MADLSAAAFLAASPGAGNGGVSDMAAFDRNVADARLDVAFKAQHKWLFAWQQISSGIQTRTHRMMQQTRDQCAHDNKIR